MKKLSNNVIYDETNSSINLGSIGGSSATTEVHRQLEITVEEYDRKASLFRSLLAIGGNMKGRFNNCTIDKDNKQIFAITLYTPDGGALTMQLSKYPNDSTYFGSRGSPTKLLSGQNLISLREHSDIEETMERMSCTRFEALSVVGLRLAHRAFKDNGMLLFTKVERAKIAARDVYVQSIGFATYLDFGAGRNRALHWLAYLMDSKVSFGNDEHKLGEFLGLKTEKWRTDTGKRDKTAAVSKYTSLLTKMMRGQHAQFSQMLYLKGEEISAKQNGSGAGNALQVERLSTLDRSDLNTKLVRIDNVFYRPAIEQWLNASGVEIAVPGRPTIRECGPLFDNEETVRRMCAHMCVDLGMRTFLNAPTLQEIENIVYSYADYEADDEDAGAKAAPKANKSSTIANRVLRDRWYLGRCNLRINEHGHLDWDLPYGSSKDEQSMHKELLAKHYLDISLPPHFYAHLNRVRQEFFHTVDDSMVMSAHAVGYSGKLVAALEGPTQIQARARKQMRTFLAYARNSIALPIPASKKKVLAAAAAAVTKTAKTAKA